MLKKSNIEESGIKTKSGSGSGSGTGYIDGLNIINPNLFEMKFV